MAEVFKVEGKVTLDTSEFHAAVDEATEQGKELAEELGEQAEKAGQSWENVFAHTLGDIIADFVKQASQALVDFTKESISIASSLEEVQNVVDVTFGDGAAQIERWAKNARTQFGLTELQAKQFASTMGAMLKSMDVPEEQIYEMSTALAELASDLASFHDLSFEDAFAKIRAGISGETEPLKQLGINMSVATLEAYALKNGITESWQEMSIAEQAMLRYNYMLEAASDAQGDFARTSGSYANSMRLLATNINSVKASIGEGLLPTLTSAANWINQLFEKDSVTLLAEMETGFYATSAAIDLNNRKVQGLLNTIEELQGKQSLTTDETMRYQGAVQVLCEMYPELNRYVDQSTGFFTESASVIREETAAIAENLLEKARLAYQEEKLALLAADAAKTQYDYARATAELTAVTAALDHYNSAIEQLYQNAVDYTGEMFDERAIGRIKNMIVNEGKTIAEALNAEFYHSFNQLDDTFWDSNSALLATANAVGGVSGEYAKLVSENKRLTEAEAELKTAVEEKNAALEAEIDFQNQSGDLYGNLSEGAEAMEDMAGSAEDMADGLAKAEDKTDEFTSALQDLKKQAESVKKMFEELEEYKLDNFNGIKKQIEGVYDVFANAGKVKGTTADKMFAGLDSQVEQLERFQTAYQQLQELGAGDNLLSQFEFDTESIAEMEALITSGAEGVATANEKLTELGTVQTEVAKMLSETALAVDEEYQAMLTDAEEANQELTKKTTEIQTAASEMVTSVAENGAAAIDELGKVQTVGDTLGSSEWKPKINPVDNATAVISAVESMLADLDGKHVYTYIHTVRVGDSSGVSKPSNSGKPSGGSGAGANQPATKAVGMDYVPYDEYYALLHKGEAVLTKAEADNWRKGNGKVSTGLQPINVTLNLNGVAQNPYEVADEVRNALELMRWRA